MPVLRASEPTLPAGRLVVLYDKNKMVRRVPALQQPASVATFFGALNAQRRLLCFTVNLTSIVSKHPAAPLAYASLITLKNRVLSRIL